MTSQRRLLAASAAALVLGVALMVPFEAVATRVLGVAALFAFIVLGVFAIASPQWLGEPEDGSGLEDNDDGRSEGRGLT